MTSLQSWYKQRNVSQLLALPTSWRFKKKLFSFHHKNMTCSSEFNCRTLSCLEPHSSIGCVLWDPGVCGYLTRTQESCPQGDAHWCQKLVIGSKWVAILKHSDGRFWFKREERRKKKGEKGVWLTWQLLYKADLTANQLATVFWINALENVNVQRHKDAIY